MEKQMGKHQICYQMRNIKVGECKTFAIVRLPFISNGCKYKIGIAKEIWIEEIKFLCKKDMPTNLILQTTKVISISATESKEITTKYV